MDKSLEAVLTQDYPAERMEVIVADGMSTDGTRDVISAIRARDPRVALIDNLGKIVPTGLNAALACARGTVIVRVDGHCIIAADYVRRCVEHLLKDGVDGVGGPLKTIGRGTTAQSIAAAMGSTFGVGGAAFRTSSNRTEMTDTVPFPAYTRLTIERVGLFDEELVRNQDDEYNYRLRSLGGKLLLAADVQSVYYSRGSLRALGRQYFQYGYWKVRVTQKHPRQMRPRQFVPPAFVAALLASLALAPVVAPARAILSLLVMAYGVADVAASLMTARRFGARHLRLLPIIYPILHLSYGLGYLVGLVKFRDRWRGS